MSIIKRLIINPSGQLLLEQTESCGFFVLIVFQNCKKSALETFQFV